MKKTMRKKLLAILMTAAMLVSMSVPCFAALSNASGSTSAPHGYSADQYSTDWYLNDTDLNDTQESTDDGVFKIANAKDLLGFALLTYYSDVPNGVPHTSAANAQAVTDGKVFELTGDITFNEGWSVDDDETILDTMVEWPGIAKLYGTLDGKGYTVSGLYAPNAPQNFYIGESKWMSSGDFGFIRRVSGETTTIKNLSIENSYFYKGSGLIAATEASCLELNVEDVSVDVNIYHENVSYLGGILNITTLGANGQTINLTDVTYAGDMKVDAYGTGSNKGAPGAIIGILRNLAGGSPVVNMKNVQFTGRSTGTVQLENLIGEVEGGTVWYDECLFGTTPIDNMPVSEAIDYSSEVGWFLNDANKVSEGEETYWPINSAARLYALAHATWDTATYTTGKAVEDLTRGKVFKLTCDIDMNPGWDYEEGKVPGNTFPGISRFAGTFDGQGYTVSHLYIMQTYSDNTNVTSKAGEFGFICRMTLQGNAPETAETVTLKNIVLKDGMVINGNGVMGTASQRVNVALSNIYSDLDIDWTTKTDTHYVAGVIGVSWSPIAQTIDVSDVVYAGTIKAKQADGKAAPAGLFGYIQTANGTTLTATDCLYMGTTPTGFDEVSGIKSENANATFKLDRCAMGAKTTLDDLKGEMDDALLDADPYMDDAALAEKLEPVANHWTAVQTVENNELKTVAYMPMGVAELLNQTVYAQVATAANTGEDAGTVNLRILGLVSSLDWSKVGYTVSVKVGSADATTATYETTTVYESILAGTETVTAASKGGSYFAAITVKVPTDQTVVLRINAVKTSRDGSNTVNGVRTTTITVVNGVIAQ